MRQEWTVGEAQCSLIGPGQAAALCMIRTSNHRNLKLCPWAFSGHRSVFSLYVCQTLCLRVNVPVSPLPVIEQAGQEVPSSSPLR